MSLLENFSIIDNEVH